MTTIPWLLEYWYATIAGLGGLSAGVTAMIRRYRKSIGGGSQPFSTYVAGTARLAIGRHFSLALARQFGMRKYAAIKLQTFPTHLYVPSVEQARLEIDTAYVKLSLSSATNERVSDLSLLDPDSGSVLIFGEPGSGKSSLTKKLFRQSCEFAYLFPDSSRLPIHIELRSLQWAKAQENEHVPPAEWLRAEVIRIASDLPGIHDPKFTVDAFTRTAGLVVFLDGLDEVPSQCVEFASIAIRGVIESLRQESRETTVIITARTQLRGVLPRRLLDNVSSIYNIDPFTPADIFTFLRRWPYKGDSLTETQRIFSNLQEHQTMSEMCTNPLVLSMYVAQDQRYASSDNLQSVRLPDTRPEFYRSVVGELLLYRRSEQLGKRPGGTHLRKQREMLLGRIALDHLLKSEDPANSISWNHALHVTRQLIGAGSDADAEQYLREMSIDTGIFTEERLGESLRFMHLTLCEYLAAMEATEAESVDLNALFDTVSARDRLVNNSTGRARRLWEVLVFAVALLSRGERQKAVQKLVSLGTSLELVVRSIRESQAYDLPLFDQCVHQLTNELSSTPFEQWDGEWLSKVRLVISCLNDLANLEHLSVGAFTLRPSELLKELTNTEAGRLERLFDMYLEFSPAEALALAESLGLEGRFRSTSRLVQAMQQPDFVVFGMAQVSDRDGDWISWAAILAEAGLTHALVAQMLLDEEPLSLVPDSVAGPEYAWHKTGTAAHSLYGSTLAVATQNIGSLENGISKGLPRVGLLSTISPTQTLFAGQIGYRRTAYARVFMSGIVLALLSMSAYLSMPPTGFSKSLMGALFGGTLGLSLMSFASYQWGSLAGLLNVFPGYRLRVGESLQTETLNLMGRPRGPFNSGLPVVTDIGGGVTLLLPKVSLRTATATGPDIADPYDVLATPIGPSSSDDRVLDLRFATDAKQVAFLMPIVEAFTRPVGLSLPARPKGWAAQLIQFISAGLPGLILRRLRGHPSSITVDLNTGNVLRA